MWARSGQELRRRRGWPDSRPPPPGRAQRLGPCSDAAPQRAQVRSGRPSGRSAACRCSSGAGSTSSRQERDCTGKRQARDDGTFESKPRVWSVSSPCVSLPRPRSVRLSARRGLAGAWGPLSARPPSSSHGRRRPLRRRSRRSPGSQSGRLATAGLLATAVFPEQGGGTQCIMGQGGVTFRLALGPPPQPHSQTF